MGLLTFEITGVAVRKIDGVMNPRVGLHCSQEILPDLYIHGNLIIFNTSMQEGVLV